MQLLAKSTSGLSREDIPRRLQVSVGQAQRQFRPALVGGRAKQQIVVRKPSPVWFSKMDRNSDGDLSPREFIGSEEDFRNLDADGDGLISSDEARQFEERLKQQKAKAEAKK